MPWSSRSLDGQDVTEEDGVFGQALGSGTLHEAALRDVEHRGAAQSSQHGGAAQGESTRRACRLLTRAICPACRVLGTLKEYGGTLMKHSG